MVVIAGRPLALELRGVATKTTDQRSNEVYDDLGPIVQDDRLDRRERQLR